MTPVFRMMEASRGNAEAKEQDRIPYALLLCLALVHSLLYMSVVPPWGHYDEPTHFEYAWLIANRRALPQRDDYNQHMRREVAASMLEHRFFHGLRFRPDLLAQDKPIWLGLSELNHPPFYYLLLALPLRFVRHTDVVFQLYVTRLVSVLLYLASIAIGYRLTGELVVPGHPLRWAVPGMMALLPAYIDLMTSVNNDVGAVVLFSLFLWGAVRTIVRGVSLLHLVWVAATSVLCVYTKNTASVAVIFVPIVLALALFRRPWRRWGRAGLLAVGLLLLLIFFSWGDAAMWYRFTTQTAPTSQDVVNAPLGKKAIALEVTPDEPAQQVIQFLPQEDAEALQGETVTQGAWVWATQPIQVRSPTLYDGQQSAGQLLQVGVTPAFYAITTTVSAGTDHIQVILGPSATQAQQRRIVVYYDGIVLVKGERSQDSPPSFDDAKGREGVWGGRPFVNRIRNGSAEATWPRVRSWVDRALQKYARRAPSQFLASILDWERTGRVHQETAVSLLQTFWARFGWSQVGLSEGWYWGLGMITILGAVGAIVGWVRLWRSDLPPFVQRGVGLLAMVGLLIWMNAFLRPHPLVGKPFIPGARYTYPVIAPSVLALVGGWWTLAPRRFRQWLLLAMFSVLGLLDVMSLWTLSSFYYGR